jgi:hypothetical protein
MPTVYHSEQEGLPESGPETTTVSPIFCCGLRVSRSFAVTVAYIKKNKRK